MNEKKINFFISTPEGVAFKQNIEWCVLPAIDGEWAVKFGHAPVVLLLGCGTLRIKADSWHYFHVKSGIAQVGKDKINIICDSAINASKFSKETLEHELSELQGKSPETQEEKNKHNQLIQEVKSKLHTLHQMQASA